MKLTSKLISILLCITTLLCVFLTISWAEEPEATEEPPSQTTTTTTTTTTVPSPAPDPIPEAPPIASLYDSSSDGILSTTVCLISGSVKELHFRFETSDGVTLASATNDELLKGVTLNKGGEFSFSVPKPINGPGNLASVRFNIPKGKTSTAKLVITKWINGKGTDVTSSVSYVKRTATASYNGQATVPTQPNQPNQPQTITGTFVYVPSGTVPTIQLPQDLIDNPDNALTVTENTAEGIVEVFSLNTTTTPSSLAVKDKITLKDSHTNIKVIIIVAIIMLLIAGAATTVIIVSKKKSNNKIGN